MKLSHDPQLTGSVIDLEHLRDFTWLAITGSIEGNYPEPVLTASLQTSDHQTSATDFSFLCLKNTNIRFLRLRFFTILITLFNPERN